MPETKKKFVVLDVVPHRVFSIGINADYLECLSLANGIVLELGTARRMLQEYSLTETNLINKLLDSYELVILRLNNDEQILATSKILKRTDTGYSKAVNKVGYLDRVLARELFEFVQNLYS